MSIMSSANPDFDGRRLLGALLSLLCGLAMARCVAAAPARPARYMYVIGCEATVDKLDTYTGTQVEEVDLATRTGVHRIIPAPSDPQQFCLSEGALYARAKRIFYTVIALKSDVDPDDPQDYDVLGFSVPGLHLVYHRPAARHAEEAPKIVLRAGGAVALQTDMEPMEGSIVDLGVDAQTGLPVHARIIETAGKTSLIQLLPTPAGELEIATWRAGHPYVRLHDTPSTTVDNVHLTPGGQAVLVEETKLSGGTMIKTSRLAIFDSDTGARLSEISDPAVRNGSLVAIAPVGKAVYYDGRRYRFVTLGRSFAGEPAVRPADENNERAFFADR